MASNEASQCVWLRHLRPNAFRHDMYPISQLKAMLITTDSRWSQSIIRRHTTAHLCSLWITIQERGKLWMGRDGRQSYSVVKQNSLKETQEEHRKWKGSDLLTQILCVKNNLFTFFAFSPSITKTSSHHHTFRKEGNSIKTVFVVPPLSALSIVHCLHCHCRKLLSCF